MVALKGSCELHLEGRAGSFVFNLSDPSEGVLIPPAYWREMHELGPETLLMVLASDDYDEGDYIRNKDDFKSWLNGLSEVKQIPYLDLSRQPVPLKDTETSLMGVVRSGHFINGPQVGLFEKEFAESIGASHVVGVGNGLDALTLILAALGVGNGDEVIVCAAGFVATALAVSRLGAKTVFVDCLPDANMDPSTLKDAINERTKAIIPTHLYGFPADIDAIAEAALPRNIPVIEDACQAHGALYKGRYCGNLGLAAAFSFYPTKNIGALGDAGCVATNDDGLASKVRQLANYGASKKYQHDLLGYNSRLDELQAAVLRLKLPHLKEWNERRRHLSATYEQGLNGISDIAIPQISPKTSPCFYAYAVRVRNGRRQALIDYLKERGIETNIHYPVPIHRQNCYKDLYGDKAFPEAESWADETLSLPLTPYHSQNEINHVCKALLEFFERKG
jgi:dTDP-4-amino-4,6-dideoxygalactose transaminase